MSSYGIAPPPIEAVGLAYFTPLMAPVPVTTRLGKPASDADTVVPWLRLEAAGGPLRPDELLYDLSIILHSYGPQNLETEAEANICRAIGLGARGVYTFTVTAGGIDYWVAHSTATTPVRQNDPLVNMPRYKAMLTWRMPGQGIGVS